MSANNKREKYVAFFRGINIGGHHKVPMAILKQILEQNGFSKIVTLLNSGNVIFEAINTNTDVLEKEIEFILIKNFQFPIAVIVYSADDLFTIYDMNPFHDVILTKEIRFYVRFLKKEPTTKIELPWTSCDYSYKILKQEKRIVFSYLDLSMNNTPMAMEEINKLFGKENTTRNWNTIERIASKLT